MNPVTENQTPQTVPPTPAAAPPATPPPNTQPTTPTPPAEKSGGPNKAVLIGVVLILVLMIVGGIGALSYMNTQPPTPISTPAPTPTPTSEIQSIQTELDSIATGSVDADFTEVDREIDGL